jgi:predicted MFS family arabinose efflux permease
LSSLAYFALPLLDFDLTLTLVALFVVFLFVELAIVSSVPLFTEVLPGARSVMLSGIAGANAVGRLGGAAIGGVLYAGTENFVLVGTASLVLGLLATALFWRYVPEQVEQTA